MENTPDKVVKFYPKGAAKDPDVVLERAMGIYDQVLIIGYNKDEELEVRGSLNFDMKSVFFALDAFKFMVLRGDFGHRLTDKEQE